MQGGGGGKNIDPSSVLEFIVVVPAQAQSGREVQEGAVQERARRPAAQLAALLPGRGTLARVLRAAARQAARPPPPLRGEERKEEGRRE